MNSFPDTISVSNRANFATLKTELLQSKLRQDIYEFLVTRANEEEEFVLPRNANVENIIDELKEKGWKAELAYGNTSLFIYTDKPPLRCTIAQGRTFC